MAVNSKKIVLEPVEGSRYKRMRCSQCNGQTLHVEYGPLRNPKSGKNRKGFFAICPNCPDSTTRITSGHRE
jgi:hypothetical protein